MTAGVYRCGHPNERNFAFLETLDLRSIMYLSADDYRPHTKNWAEAKGLRVFHHRLEPTKEPFTVVDEDGVVQAIEEILGQLALGELGWALRTHADPPSPLAQPRLAQPPQ